MRLYPLVSHERSFNSVIDFVKQRSLYQEYDTGSFHSGT
ncbi:hypothetical protein SAMN04488121_102861 [Chitinophaga filiformis]|uniref:Uncharacterized protein n=1 Tax=Chitinophaga filiformis TaxID=104663 RepID=A0A1G7NMA8_CHIFI|nr:hypothetical protein SAMN04488121_102861 [Chitinophaga filiformis]